MSRPALDDKGLARMQFRLALFKRRGMTEREADLLAERLAQRDHDRDDRRVCAECKHARPQLRCTHGHAVLMTVMQRCQQFQWMTPTT